MAGKTDGTERTGSAEKTGSLSRLLRRTMKNYAPPSMMTVSEWAAAKRVLGQENAEPGPWRNERTPYMVEIMDAFNDPVVREITVVAGAQVGKSEGLLNMMGHSMDEDPSNMMYIQPTVDDCKRFSRLRITALIEQVPSLKAKVGIGKSRDSSNTIMQKSFPGGTLILVGTNAPSGLASTPCRYVFADEVDRFADSAGDEGDPLSLARARTITFYNSKIVACSTPTSTQKSKINKLYLEGTRERWHHQCPECGTWQVLKFRDLIFDKEEIDGRTQVLQAQWCCPGCGALISQRRAKKTPAQWLPEDGHEIISKRHRSFWLTPLDSPWLTWEEIAQRWFDSLGDVLRQRSVTNTYLGELWEDMGELPDPTGLMARREEYAAELPDGVLALTCGVDTQDDRLEYEIVGWGKEYESWGIRYGRILGDPQDEDVWLRLDEILNHEYRRADGTAMQVEYTFVDSGGHRTTDVYIQTGRRFARRVFPIKGMAGDGKELVKRPKETEVVQNDRVLGKVWRYDIGVDTGKSLIFASMAIVEKGPNYMHFPQQPECGYDFVYFNGLCSETQVLTVSNGVSKWKWEKLPGHERNEPLDCRNYALAACYALAPDMKQRSGEKAPPAAKHYSGTIRNREF